MKLAIITLDLHQHATTLFTIEASRDAIFTDQRYALEGEVFRYSAVARHQFCFFSFRTLPTSVSETLTWETRSTFAGYHISSPASK